MLGSEPSQEIRILDPAPGFSMAIVNRHTGQMRVLLKEPIDWITWEAKIGVPEQPQRGRKKR